MARESRIDEHLPSVGKKEADAVERVLEDGWISQEGDEVEKLEKKICELTGAEHAVATDSGTAALHLAVQSLVEPGDEVVIPDFTYGSTGLSVTVSEATPKIVDIKRSNLGMDPDSLKKHLGPETRTVMVAHLFGRVAEMEGIMEIADEQDIPVIEDASQALGASLHGNQAGSMGEIGCFSFGWSKNVTTGKGGALVTDNDELAAKIRQMANLGRPEGERDVFARPEGYNYRLDNIRAAIGNVQLEKLEDTLERKREIFGRYRSELGSLEAVELLPLEKRENSRDSPWMFGLFTDERDGLQAWLRERGIETRKFFPPLHEMPAFPDSKKASFPVTEDVSSHGLALPGYPRLEDGDVSRITEEIRNFFE